MERELTVLAEILAYGRNCGNLTKNIHFQQDSSIYKGLSHIPATNMRSTVHGGVTLNERNSITQRATLARMRKM